MIVSGTGGSPRQHAQIDAVSNSTTDTTAEEKAVLDAEKKNSEAQDSLTSAESAYRRFASRNATGIPAFFTEPEDYRL